MVWGKVYSMWCEAGVDIQYEVIDRAHWIGTTDKTTKKLMSLVKL